MNHLFDESQKTLFKKILEIYPYLIFILFYLIHLGQILHQQSMKVKKFGASPGIEPGFSCMAGKRATN